MPGDVGHTPWSQRVRSLLLGPHGGGTTRRRASDAVRVGIAAVLVVICIPLVQANTSVEIHVTELVTPPPSGIHWLITAHLVRRVHRRHRAAWSSSACWSRA